MPAVVKVSTSASRIGRQSCSIVAMAAATYDQKLAAFEDRTCLPRLEPAEQAYIRDLAARHRFTVQELRQVSEAARDFRMWQEDSLRRWWQSQAAELDLIGRELKKALLGRLRQRLTELRRVPNRYPKEGLGRPPDHSLKLVAEPADRTVLGMCPVASDETICCNLRTVDAVENCGFGCSYCTIQTFYSGRVVFDQDLGRKLLELELDPDRFYHIGTGQSSDSLIWGNRHGILDALCDFARARPNVLLELKTKAKNVSYFLGREVPRNLVLSWSLSTPTLIRNEEHFTASLEQRLDAARRVADSGIGVAFHCHPIIHYQGWKHEYAAMVAQVVARFDPSEVAFLSFGSLTFIKPVVRAIRRRGGSSKILQAELVPGAKGKLSYPEPLKKQLFSHLYRSFTPWHDQVYMYLCMEEARYWQSTFGFVYSSNEAFENDFARAARAKLGI